MLCIIFYHYHFKALAFREGFFNPQFLWSKIKIGTWNNYEKSQLSIKYALISSKALATMLNIFSLFSEGIRRHSNTLCEKPCKVRGLIAKISSNLFYTFRCMK